MSSEENPAALTERRGNVLLITLNRPEARNAVNSALSTAVGRALADADTDPEIRCVVVTGAGDKSFSAGADLKAISRGEDIHAEGHPEWGFGGITRHVLSVPVIAAINGTALGGGLEIAMSSDLVVAADSAALGLPEVKRGLIAGAGGAFRLAGLVPQRVAMEMILTGEPVSAQRAHDLGLVNRVVPAAELLDAALALAEQIAVNAPLAVQASKRVALGIRDGQRVDEEVLWEHSDREFGAIMVSDDAREGTTAFTEKREPRWQAK